MINAVTLVTADMARSYAFYAALGFDTHASAGRTRRSRPTASATASSTCSSTPRTRRCRRSGAASSSGSPTSTRCTRARRAHGYAPEMAPADAPWGERYFHLRDPDGHELSFARLLVGRSASASRPCGASQSASGSAGTIRLRADPGAGAERAPDDVVEVGGLAERRPLVQVARVGPQVAGGRPAAGG